MLDAAAVNSELADTNRWSVPVHLKAKVDRDDVAQEVWTHLLRGSPHDRFSGRAECEVRTYLRKTIASVVTDQTRRYDRGKRRASRERSLQSRGDGSSARIATCLAANQSTPSQRLSRREVSEHLRAAAESLPDDQRRAVELHHIDNHSLAETAAIMAKTEPAVAGLLRRGLRELRNLLEGLGDD